MFVHQTATVAILFCQLDLTIINSLSIVLLTVVVGGDSEILSKKLCAFLARVFKLHRPITEVIYTNI